MTKFYTMVVQDNKTGRRFEYVNKKQGAAPAGCTCIAVTGYFEKGGRDRE